MGSKSRHAKYIVPILLKYLNNCDRYIEPFVGGANIIDKIATNKDRFGYDIDPDLICLFKAVSETGWMPPKEFSEEEYKLLKSQPPSPLKGYAGFALSYGGKKFGGWCRDSLGQRNYVEEAYKNALKQFPLLKGIYFNCSNYLDLDIPDNSLIYCDPPYASTTQYVFKFDHVRFWSWVREKSAKNTVVVSEYEAPSDFECIWSRETCSSLTKDTGSKKAFEKLFVLKK